jgi:CheY-like chemotaxis protein
MNNKDIYSFYLAALMRIPDLEIRKLANENPSLLVGGYYKELSIFIKDAPNIRNSLGNIAALKANDKDIKYLDEIKEMFINIGCYNLASDIDDIINVGIRGNNKFAANIAKKILENILHLHSRIKSAEKTEVLTEQQDDDTLLPQETQILLKAIKLLYHEEASRKLRILIVDDAPSMIETVNSVLGNEYKVFGLTNPTMIKDLLRQIMPELFLLDYQMPDINGFELVPIIRKFEEHKDTPIIFLTSIGTMDHVSAAYALGACDFIVKPFQDHILRKKVSKHIIRKEIY